MTRHTQGHVDDVIIKARRPYEPEDVKEYRIANFRAITKSAMNRAINALQRIFSKANVTVKWPDAADEFFTAKNFEDCDFMGYINKFVIRRMIEDANGLLVWWADFPGTENTRVTPRPIILLSENVLHLTPDVLTFESEEKSKVEKLVDRKRVEVMEGTVFYIITAQGYYKREQYGPIERNQFRIVNGYAHKLGYLPYITLGGEEMMETKKRDNRYMRWFASYFEPCTQYADEALAQFSDWQGVMVTSAQPLREMEPIKCPNRRCRKGEVVEVVRGKEKVKNCTTCDGRGEITPMGPYGIVWRKSKRAGLQEEAKADPVPAIRFMHVDPAIVELIEKAWRKLIEDVEKSLHLLFIDEAQSGTAKEIDREDKTSTLDRIGQNVFGVIVENSIEICLALLKIAGEPVITMPATFILRSDEELRKEITELSGEGIGPLYRARAMQQLMAQRFPEDQRLNRVVTLLIYFDTAFGYTPTEKSTMMAGGVLSDTIVQRSALAQALAYSMAQDMEVDALMKTPLKSLAEKLKKLIDAELAANPVIPPPDPNADPNAPNDGGPAGGNFPPKRGGGKPAAKPPARV